MSSKLTKENGEWTDKHLARCAKLGIPPNRHPDVDHEKPAPYPEGGEIPGKLRGKTVELEVEPTSPGASEFRMVGVKKPKRKAKK